MNTLHFPDKQAGYNGSKHSSKQTLIKAINSGATTIKGEKVDY